MRTEDPRTLSSLLLPRMICVAAPLAGGLLVAACGVQLDAQQSEPPEVRDAASTVDATPAADAATGDDAAVGEDAATQTDAEVPPEDAASEAGVCEVVSCGEGACARSVQICADAEAPVCVPGDPSDELSCDLIDNDCDGAVDEAIDAYTPLVVTGFTADVIAESAPPSASTSRSIDGSAYVLYSSSFGEPGRGLPADGSLQAGAHRFQLAAYSGSNALVLAQNESSVLTLSTPVAVGAVSLLGFATEGNGQLDVTLTYTDDSTEVFENSALSDWFGPGPSFARGFDRVGRTSGIPDRLDGLPRLYAIDLVKDCATRDKLVRAIDIKNTSVSSGVRAVLLGVSAGQ